jgi:hypothetical protein
LRLSNEIAGVRVTDGRNVGYGAACPALGAEDRALDDALLIAGFTEQLADAAA